MIAQVYYIFSGFKFFHLLIFGISARLSRQKESAIIFKLFILDINARDKHGQTIMHEVAREWNIDVAIYLKTRGMDIDIEDNWGRTPLFVAVAANYTEMVQWLLESGGNFTRLL